MLNLLLLLQLPDLPPQPTLSGEVNSLLMYFIALLICVICVLGVVIGYLFVSNKNEQKENRAIQKDTLDAFRLLSDGLTPIGSGINEVKTTTTDTNKVVSIIDSKISK